LMRPDDERFHRPNAVAASSTATTIQTPVMSALNPHR
jgi:hypothetical protein